MADGSAAERFAGEFMDSYGLDGVSEQILHEVTRRTPGFHAWQDPRWLVHCHDAAAFIPPRRGPHRDALPLHRLRHPSRLHRRVMTAAEFGSLRDPANHP
ncbi:CbrC family protein [Streptomyces sp. NPDC093510]|uniref:CbrC family protein n=1 Tax=Streptomyces sp. NPDC093510 TaxID=3155199 RepID=UPI00342A0765